MCSEAPRGGNAVDLRKISFAHVVTPAEAGVQNAFKNLDSGFRRNDVRGYRNKGASLNQ